MPFKFFRRRIFFEWADDMKLKNASKKWHRKALMIDTRKTMLVLESADVKSEYVPPLIHSELVKTEHVLPLTRKRKLNPAMQTFFLSLKHNVDCLTRAQVDK
jgi:hypothetical protein